ncbi:MAG: hypothetical protein ACOY94_11930 [Bacillota bacterium]
MFFSFITERRRAKTRPLAHCCEEVPGRLRLEQTGATHRIVMLSANETGARFRIEQPLSAGVRVVGEYMVNGVAFGFHGEVVEAQRNRKGSWDAGVRFTVAGL